MRHIARLAAALPLLLAACAPNAETVVADSAAPAAAPAVDVAAVKHAIEQSTAKGMDALHRGDVTAWIELYDDDAVVMMSGAPAWRGHSEIAAHGSAMFANVKFADIKFTSTSVDVAGDYAIETGTYSMTTSFNGGKPVADTGKHVTVWKKQGDGSWKIYRDIGNTSIAARQ